MEDGVLDEATREKHIEMILQKEAETKSEVSVEEAVEEVEKMKIVPAEEIEGVSCGEVSEDEIPEVFALAEEMVKFCHEKQGVGLAAPQIGINKKFFVWLDGDKWQLAINPTVFPDRKKSQEVLERCLSYEGKYFRVKRYKKITAVFYSIDGKTGKLKKYSRQLSGDRAWIFQHETDHINGITIATCGLDMTVPMEEQLLKRGE